MIQRIQTLYLLLTTICMSVALCTPAGEFFKDGLPVGEMGNLRICWEGATNGDYSIWALFLILILTVMVSFLGIFLFRHRMLQIRFCIFSGLLIIGYYLAFAAFVYVTKSAHDVDFTISWTRALPAVGLILDYLAFRGIMRDELMIRSLDRLR